MLMTEKYLPAHRVGKTDDRGPYFQAIWRVAPGKYYRAKTFKTLEAAQAFLDTLQPLRQAREVIDVIIDDQCPHPPTSYKAV